MGWLDTLQRIAEWIGEEMTKFSERQQAENERHERNIMRHIKNYQDLSDREVLEKVREAKEARDIDKYRACVYILQERGVIKPKEKSE